MQMHIHHKIFAAIALVLLLVFVLSQELRLEKKSRMSLLQAQVSCLSSGQTCGENTDGVNYGTNCCAGLSCYPSYEGASASSMCMVTSTSSAGGCTGYRTCDSGEILPGDHTCNTHCCNGDVTVTNISCVISSSFSSFSSTSTCNEATCNNYASGYWCTVNSEWVKDDFQFCPSGCVETGSPSWCGSGNNGYHGSVQCGCPTTSSSPLASSSSSPSVSLASSAPSSSSVSTTINQNPNQYCEEDRDSQPPLVVAYFPFFSRLIADHIACGEVDPIPPNISTVSGHDLGADGCPTGERCKYSGLTSPKFDCYPLKSEGESCQSSYDCVDNYTNGKYVKKIPCLCSQTMGGNSDGCTCGDRGAGSKSQCGGSPPGGGLAGGGGGAAGGGGDSGGAAGGGDAGGAGGDTGTDAGGVSTGGTAGGGSSSEITAGPCLANDPTCNSSTSGGSTSSKASTASTSNTTGSSTSSVATVAKGASTSSQPCQSSSAQVLAYKKSSFFASILNFFFGKPTATLIYDPVKRMRVTFTRSEPKDPASDGPTVYIGGSSILTGNRTPIIIPNGEWFDLSLLREQRGPDYFHDGIKVQANVDDYRLLPQPNHTLLNEIVFILDYSSDETLRPNTPIIQKVYGTIEIEGTPITSVFCGFTSNSWFCPEQAKDGTIQDPNNDEIWIDRGIAHFALHAAYTATNTDMDSFIVKYGNTVSLSASSNTSVGSSSQTSLSNGSKTSTSSIDPCLAQASQSSQSSLSSSTVCAPEDSCIALTECIGEGILKNPGRCSIIEQNKWCCNIQTSSTLSSASNSSRSSTSTNSTSSSAPQSSQRSDLGVNASESSESSRSGLSTSSASNSSRSSLSSQSSRSSHSSAVSLQSGLCCDGRNCNPFGLCTNPFINFNTCSQTCGASSGSSQSSTSSSTSLIAYVASSSPTACVSLCGNGQLECTEQCDDGNQEDADSCNRYCGVQLIVSTPGLYYADSLTKEEYDQFVALLPKNSAKCIKNVDCPNAFQCVREFCVQSDQIATLPYVCGNAYKDRGEDCDAGVQNSDQPNAFCRTDCSLVRCGDGIPDTPLEQCDDGNTTIGDGCDATCQPERPAPNETQTLPAQIIELPFMNDLVQSTSSVQKVPSQPTDQTVITTSKAPSTPDSGPAALAVMLAGGAAGWLWRRRK